MSLHVPALTLPQEIASTLPLRPLNNPVECESLEAFKELLQSKGLLDASFQLLYNPILRPSCPNYKALNETLDAPIDYVFQDREIPLTSRAWLHQIHQQFPTIKFCLRGSKAARIICPIDQFQALIEAFAHDQKDPELLITWQKIRKKLPQEALPHDTDWMGKVKGISAKGILNRLVHAMADLTKSTHEEIFHHGFQEKAIAQVNRFVLKEGNFAIASIGKEKKADIAIGDLSHPYLFQRDCFLIKMQPDGESSIGKRKFFWQAVVDRIFGIVRLEARHAENFYCFLAAMELKTKGCHVIEDQIQLEHLVVPFRHLPTELIAEKIMKRIDNHQIDPFCYLFNLCCVLDEHAEGLWETMLPRFRNIFSTHFHPLAWRIYLLIDAHRISFSDALHSLKIECIRSPGFLPLFPQKGPLAPSHEPHLPAFFKKERAFRTLENQQMNRTEAAATLFSMWVKGELDMAEEKRICRICHLTYASITQNFRTLLTTDLYQSALPFYLNMLRNMPVDELYDELSLERSSSWNLLFNETKKRLSLDQRAELIINRPISHFEKLSMLLREGLYDAFSMHFPTTSLTEMEAAQLLEILPDSFPLIRLQLLSLQNRVTIDDVLRCNPNEPALRPMIEKALAGMDWIQRPDFYRILAAQGVQISGNEAEKLVSYVESGAVRLFEDLHAVLDLLSSSHTPCMQRLIQSLVQQDLVTPQNGHLLWPYVLQCGYANPAGLTQLVSPTKEVSCFRQWIQICAHQPAPELRIALFTNLSNHTELLLELVKNRPSRSKKSALESFIYPKPGDPPEVRQIILLAVEKLLPGNDEHFWGLELLQRLSSHATAQERPSIVRLYIQFTSRLKKRMELPEHVPSWIETLIHRFNGWKLDPALKHDLLFNTRWIKPSASMQEIIANWTIALCENKSLVLTFHELNCSLAIVLEASDSLQLRFFKSHQFQNQLAHQQKFQMVQTAINWQRAYQKDASMRAAQISHLLLASRCSFGEAIPRETQQCVFDDLFAELMAALRKKQGQDFEYLLYALLWFSSSKFLLNFSDLSLLKTCYFALRNNVSDEDMNGLDSNAVSYLQSLIQRTKTSDAIETLSAFLLEYLTIVTEFPRKNDQYDDFLDAAIIVMYIVNTNTEKFQHFVQQIIQNGYCMPGTWQRTFYLILSLTPQNELMPLHPIEKPAQNCLREALFDYLKTIRARIVVSTSMSVQCNSVILYMVNCGFIDTVDEFLKAMEALNQMIYHLAPLLTHENGTPLIKMSLNLFLHFTKKSTSKETAVSVMAAMRDFREKAQALQAKGPLPTDKNQKYVIVYRK